MHEGIPFSQIEETEEIPRNSKFLACMGDGSGVKTVTKETMDEEMKKNIDILDSQEEIQANTDPQKVAGTLAVKEMVGELNDNLSSLNTSLVETKNNLSEYIVRGGVVQAVVRDNNYLYANIPYITGYSIVAKMHRIIGDHRNSFVEFVLSAEDRQVWVRDIDGSFDSSKTYNIMYMALYHKN